MDHKTLSFVRSWPINQTDNCMTINFVAGAFSCVCAYLCPGDLSSLNGRWKINQSTNNVTVILQSLAFTEVKIWSKRGNSLWISRSLDESSENNHQLLALISMPKVSVEKGRLAAMTPSWPVYWRENAKLIESIENNSGRMLIYTYKYVGLNESYRCWLCAFIGIATYPLSFLL